MTISETFSTIVNTDIEKIAQIIVAFILFLFIVGGSFKLWVYDINESVEQMLSETTWGKNKLIRCLLAFPLSIFFIFIICGSLFLWGYVIDHWNVFR